MPDQVRAKQLSVAKANIPGLPLAIRESAAYSLKGGLQYTHEISLMDRIRYIAANLLCLTGIIHVARLGMADAPVIILEVFGVVYLIIGGLLFQNKKIAYYFGAIVPLIGLLVGPVILTNPPIMVAAILGAIDVVVVVSCFCLIIRSQSS